MSGGSSYAEAKAFLEACLPDLADDTSTAGDNKLAAAIVVVIKRADLLARYIEHVGSCEGIDFLGGMFGGDLFTEDEERELKAASEEADRL